MAFWRLHYHLIWATHQRQPMIDPARESVIRATLHGKARELGFIIHAVGNVADHLHLVVSVPPRIALADCVRHCKGASSRAVNLMPGARADFKWQNGYGALSLGERSLAAVSEYVRDQKRHHNAGTARAIYERVGGDDEGVTESPAGD